MKTKETDSNERVVKFTEACDDVVTRTFYCIHDPEFGLWMSIERFDGLIWTKDASCRKEFASRLEAEHELYRFLQWRRECEAGGDPEIPFEREAA